MPPKSKTQQDTPRKHSDNKNDADSNSKPTIDYRAMGRQAYIDGKSKNQPGLGGKNKKQFDKGYDAESKRELLAAQKTAREDKKKAHLLELKKNADSEEILRKMCDNEGISELVKKKYENMVSFIREVLKHEMQTDEKEEQENENGIMRTFDFAMQGLVPLSKPYKNVVNLYANRVKKFNPKVRGAEPDEIFVKWMKQMKEDSEAITTKRDDLYRADDLQRANDFVSKLKKVKDNITDAEIDAIRKLVYKKLEAEALKKINMLAKKKKKEKISEARANRSGMSSRSSYGSRANTTPRIVGDETSGEFTDDSS